MEHGGSLLEGKKIPINYKTFGTNLFLSSIAHVVNKYLDIPAGLNNLIFILKNLERASKAWTKFL